MNLARSASDGGGTGGGGGGALGGGFARALDASATGVLRAGREHVKRPERLRDDRRRVPRGGRQGIRGERETPHRADSPLGGAPTVLPSPSPPRILPLFSLLFLLIVLLLGHDLVRVPDLVAAQRPGSVHVLVRVVPLEHADAESLPACRPDGSEAPGVRVPSHRPRLRHLAKLLGALEGVVPDAVQVRLRVKDVARGVVDERGCGLSPSAPSAAVFVVNVALTSSPSLPSPLPLRAPPRPIPLPRLQPISRRSLAPTGSEVVTTRSDGTGPGMIAGPYTLRRPPSPVASLAAIARCARSSAAVPNVS